MSKRQTDALAHFARRMESAGGVLKMHFDRARHCGGRAPGALRPDVVFELHGELTRFVGALTDDLRALAEALGDGAVAVPVARAAEGVAVLGVDLAAEGEDRTVYPEATMTERRPRCELCRFVLGPAPLPLVCANAASPYGGERVAETDRCDLFQLDIARALGGDEDAGVGCTGPKRR
jgi:hypothetical protein